MSPEDGWYQTTVGESAKFLTGFPFASQYFSSSGVRLVRGSNVKRACLDWSADITKCWPKSDSQLRPFELADGDIVVAMDGALVGRSYARIAKGDLPAYLVQRVSRLRASSIEQGLLFAWIGSDRFVKHVDSVKTHTAIPHISPRDIRQFSIVVPAERQEQRRISEALADADALIDSLEHVMAKRQAIKQGMMQQLLTGYARLPGFSSAWTTVTLGDMGTFLKGRGVKRDDVQATGVPCIRYGELYTRFINYTATTNSFVSLEVARTALPIRAGDLLFAGSGETREEIGVCVAYVGDAAAVAGGDIVVLRGGSFNPVYLATLVNTPAVVSQKARAGQGDAVVHIHSRALAAITVSIPMRTEQDAIAEVLMDADSELNVLRARLSKARAIKQGMMQELLTGQTRLPAESTS